MGDYEEAMRQAQGVGKKGEQLGFVDPETTPTDKEMRIQELAKWLETLRERELDETLRKAAEYDQKDLIVVGQTMGTLLGIEVADQQTAIQLACAFYALGKVARVIGAIAGGRRPQADSWYDMRIYGTMGLKTLETGRWA